MTGALVSSLDFFFPATAKSGALCSPNELSGAFAVATACSKRAAPLDHLSLLVAPSTVEPGVRQSSVFYQLGFNPAAPVSVVMEVVAELAAHRVLTGCHAWNDGEDNYGMGPQDYHEYLSHPDLTCEREGILMFCPSPAIAKTVEFDRALTPATLNESQRREWAHLLARYPSLGDVFGSPRTLIESVTGVYGALHVDLRYADIMLGGAASAIAWVPNQHDVSAPPSEYPFLTDRAARTERIDHLRLAISLVQAMRGGDLPPPAIVDLRITPD